LISKINLKNSHNIFFNDKERILFEVVNEETHCNYIVLKTNDGLFISKNFTVSLEEAQTNTNEVIDLSLADGDFKIFDIYRKMKIESTELMCYSFLSMLRMMRNLDGIFSINDLYGNELTIFSDQQEVYKIKCNNNNNVTNI
jgi:hypothetical protein